MPLPSSGALGIGAIRTELGSGSGSLRTLSSLAGFSTPDAISEFYGYGQGQQQTFRYLEVLPYIITLVQVVILPGLLELVGTEKLIRT